MLQHQKNILQKHCTKKNSPKKAGINSKKAATFSHINVSVFKPSFWDNLPMKRNDMKMNQIINSTFEFLQGKSENRKVRLPKGFEWIFFKSNKTSHLKTVTEFLNKNFWSEQRGKGHISVRRKYKYNYLKWLLNPPRKHYPNLETNSIKHNSELSNFLFGVVESKKKELVAVIGAHPLTYKIDSQIVQTVYVDFLCVHSHLREKKVALVLMKKLYARLEQLNFATGAIFHTFRHMPFKPISEIGKLLVRNLEGKQIPPTTDLGLIRFANIEDIPAMMEIYEKYKTDYRIVQTMNRKEFEHYFMPKNGLIYTYVITNSAGVVKDFASLHAMGKTVYLYYVSFINEKLLEIFMRNILFIMQSNNFESFFASNCFGIENVLIEKLQCRELIYPVNLYLFNYNSRKIDLRDCGLNLFY
jgi:glycylpeptide N-tetradecanoyltransferase